MNLEELKVKFIDLIMKHPDKPCVNLDSIKEQILSQNSGKFRVEREYGDLKQIIYVRWNKEKLLFKCSIVILQKKNGKWETSIRFDDSHGYRHGDMKNIKIPMGTLFKIECPILNLIINSLPEDRAKLWKKKLFDELMREKEEYKRFLKTF